MNAEFLYLMEKGNKLIHTDALGKEHILTYTGTFREVKGVLFYFFDYDEQGGVGFFSPSEVQKMRNYEP